MKWEGIPLYTMLGKVPLFLIYCLSARTARQESRPTSGMFLLFPDARDRLAGEGLIKIFQVLFQVIQVVPLRPMFRIFIQIS